MAKGVYPKAHTDLFQKNNFMPSFSMNQFQNDDGTAGAATLFRRHKTACVAAFLILALLMLGRCSFIVTNENQVTSITRLGKLNRGPLGAGLHFVMPFEENTYTVAISKQNTVISDVTGKTSNNQTVTLDGVNVTWQIMPSDANFVMFKVGAMGSDGMSDNIVPVIRDRVLRVLGRYTTTDINAHKDQIANAIMAEAVPDVQRMFGVTVDSIQIPKITYDPVFEESVRAAVKVQNDVVQQKSRLLAIQIQAEQVAAAAQGAANAQVEQAKADAQKRILDSDAAAHALKVTAEAQSFATNATAQANANAIRLSGEAAAGAVKAKVDALGGPAAYNQSLVNTALANWNGSVPQMVLGDKSGGPTAFLPLPVPSLASVAH